MSRIASIRTAVSVCSRASSSSCLSAAWASRRRSARAAMMASAIRATRDASAMAARSRRCSVIRGTLQRFGTWEQKMNSKSMAWPEISRLAAALVPISPWVVRIDRVPATAYIAAMALRDILVLPDKRLRQVCDPLKKLAAGVRKPVEDMFETMYEAPGIGLAAIQIGTPKRVITMDLAKKEEPRNPQVFINPEIVWSSQEKATYEEGCLSIPEYFDDVERPV